MSDQSDISTKTPSTFWPAAVAVLGTFLIFVSILAIVYLPGQSAIPSAVQPPEETIPRTPEARKAKLDELKAAEAKAVSTYAVLDPQKQVVRLPVDRAIELVVAEKTGK